MTCDYTISGARKLLADKTRLIGKLSARIKRLEAENDVLRRELAALYGEDAMTPDSVIEEVERG